MHYRIRESKESTRPVGLNDATEGRRTKRKRSQRDVLTLLFFLFRKLVTPRPRADKIKCENSHLERTMKQQRARARQNTRERTSSISVSCRNSVGVLTVVLRVIFVVGSVVSFWDDSSSVKKEKRKRERSQLRVSPILLPLFYSFLPVQLKIHPSTTSYVKNTHLVSNPSNPPDPLPCSFSIRSTLTQFSSSSPPGP